MVKCPRCKVEASQIIKEWDYSIFHVKQVECGQCRKTFKAYFRQGKLTHTIPKQT